MKKVLNIFLVISLFLMTLSVDSAVYAQEPEAQEGTEEPAVEATTEPPAEATTEATAEPTVEATAEPTTPPTAEPTAEPTTPPTTEPTTPPTVEPTTPPTAEPTAEPTTPPTVEPTTPPTAEPTTPPTVEPTTPPTAEPTVEATVEPTTQPTVEPTVEPTAEITEGDIGDAAASNAPYTSRVYLQNPHGSSSSYGITYKHSGTDITGSSGSLNPHRSVSVDLANESNVPSNFKGAGVVSAENELAAVVLQYGTADIMVSNGFSESQAGPTLFAPSVQCNYIPATAGQTAELAIQNASSGNVQITLRLFRAGDPTVQPAAVNLAPGKSHFFNVASILGGACNNWLGSATVTATGGNIVGTVITRYSKTNQAFSSEMVASGGSVLYFPTFQYEYAPPVRFNTNIALQNTSSSSSIIVCAEYFGASGKQGQTVQKNLGPLGKDSLRSNELGIPKGSLGAATVRAYAGGTCAAPGAAANTFVAVMNQFALGDVKRVTSYTGFVGGANNIAFPFSNWSPSSTALDTFFAVQNVSGATANITVNFYKSDGSLLSRQFNGVPAGSKVNPRISDLPGIGANGNWSGAIEVISNRAVVGLGTVQPGNLSQLASYNGIPFTP